ncbi:MAG TPA: C-GCAxxG-C-C family protein [Ignavibacteriales bacterium]|nr:C-GCAxxG-C-C family protein [Ignavibacteriales bacterium]
MKQEEAVHAFMDESYNCAQSTLLPFLKEYGILENDGKRFASVFGAGMGRMQETCGAVTGAFMVLGLEFGFTDPVDQEQRTLLLEKTKSFTGSFKNEFGTIKCRELLGCDLNTEEGQIKHKEENHRELICKECVKFAVKTLEEIIGR